MIIADFWEVYILGTYFIQILGGSSNLLDTKHLNSDWLSVIFLLKSKLIKKVIDLFPNSLTGKTALFENLSLDFSKFRNLDPIT